MVILPNESKKRKRCNHHRCAIDSEKTIQLGLSVDTIFHGKIFCHCCCLHARFLKINNFFPRCYCVRSKLKCERAAQKLCVCFLVLKNVYFTRSEFKQELYSSCKQSAICSRSQSEFRKNQQKKTTK